MLRVQVRLEFRCVVCENQVGCTLRCEGVGLAAEDPVAAVPVKCPFCHCRNYVTFTPTDGSVLEVARMNGLYAMNVMNN